MNRYATSFSDYRVITISPFTPEQVRKYLIAEKHSESDLDTLLGRIMSFSHNMLAWLIHQRRES